MDHFISLLDTQLGRAALAIALLALIPFAAASTADIAFGIGIVLGLGLAMLIHLVAGCRSHDDL